MKVKCSIEAEPRVTIACHEVRVRLSKVTITLVQVTIRGATFRVRSRKVRVRFEVRVGVREIGLAKFRVRGRELGVPKLGLASKLRVKEARLQ